MPDSRNLALSYIAHCLDQQLGFPISDFFKTLTAVGEIKSEKTLWRNFYSETPVRIGNFETFWAMVETAVETFLNTSSYEKRTASKTWSAKKDEWKQLCRSFFTWQGGRSEEMERARKKVLDQFKPVFNLLDKGTAYSLQHNFPALAAVTIDDVSFLLSFLARTDAEKEALMEKMLQCKTVDTNTMLGYVKSKEMQCWVNLIKGDYSDTARRTPNDIWELFAEKFIGLSLPQYFIVLSFLEVPLLQQTNEINPKTGKITIRLPGSVDLDLLLLFKYFLVPEERKKLLERT